MLGLARECSIGMNCEVKLRAKINQLDQPIEITEESVEETVTVLVVETCVGGKLLWEQSLLSRLLFHLSG